MPPIAAVSGLILFDKPPVWTSHDAVQFVRSRLPRKTKVGHTGTLDPLATGLLVLLVGAATRRQAQMQKQEKTYAGRMRLGLTTDTGDIDGKTVAESDPSSLSLERLRELAAGFLGSRTLPVPAFSALKHKGKPLYYYARKGLEAPVKHRTMEVRRWKVLSYEPPELSFEMDVASGTYVRSLAAALGEAAGCGAAVSQLRRTRIADLRIEDAVTEAALRPMKAVERLVRPLAELAAPGAAERLFRAAERRIRPLL